MESHFYKAVSSSLLYVQGKVDPICTIGDGPGTTIPERVTGVCYHLL